MQTGRSEIPNALSLSGSQEADTKKSVLTVVVTPTSQCGPFARSLRNYAAIITLPARHVKPSSADFQEVAPPAESTR